METEQELKTLDELLAGLDTEDLVANKRESEIHMQIAQLRLEVARLQDQKKQNKNARNAALKNRESLWRKLELEREAKQIEDDLESKRKEAYELIATAPWRDTAFDWQIEGAIKLPNRALLGDKRGLGKTLSSIIWRRVKQSRKTLVCLRKEVASDFIKEISIREPGLFVYTLIGANKETRNIAASLLTNVDAEFIVVTNIESWRRDVDGTTEDLLKIPFDGLILDEAHHIKSSQKATAQGFFNLAHSIPNVLLMTGTPIKNRPQEMFSLLHALYPDRFETEKKFLRDYCVMVGPNKWAFGEYGLTQLVSKIKHFYIARTPDDIGRKVPPPRMIEYKLDFENFPDQKRAYKEMTERNMAILNSGQAIPIVSQLAIMTRQAQVVSWPAGIKFKDELTGEYLQFDVHESAKLDWAEDLIRELTEEGERVVMFSRFKPAIYELKRRLRDIPVAVITGDEPKENTPIVFNDFDLKTAPENPKYKALLATYQTVGESANLNAATHMILLDRFWNPGNDDQAIGRVDRINSVKQATVHLPMLDNTIDVYMAALIDEKRNLVAGFTTAADMAASLAEHLQKSL